MIWTQAQNYCRQHHTDLVSGLSQLQDKEFINLTTEIESNEKLWIGLFRDTWRWSDGSNFSFRNWDLEFNHEESKNKCATTVSNGLKWGSDDCNKTKPFFCYDGEFCKSLSTVFSHRRRTGISRKIPLNLQHLNIYLFKQVCQITAMNIFIPKTGFHIWILSFFLTLRMLTV